MDEPRHFRTLLSDLEAGRAKVSVIGLGYVGLPLAIELARRYEVIGFDLKEARIDALRQGRDTTLEVPQEDLASVSPRLVLSSEPGDIGRARVHIITVPTPIDEYKRPDLRPLIAASRMVGRAIEPGDVVVYESTVYPGCTEEDCVPVLEAESGLHLASDHASPESAHGADKSATTSLEGKASGRFFIGYSPERVNPGDPRHRITDIIKVTSGSTEHCAAFVDDLYGRIISAGTHRAPSIRVAEAAKVIENTQRDVNIALINELAMLFSRLGLDTTAILEAAGTKWNFLPFRPGLVGGHCIGVDPYYLTHKAQQIGFHPEMILSGRRTNDGMGQFVAGEMIRLMAMRGCYRAGARVLVLGLTFKENCPDLRNTRVIDVVAALRHYNLAVDVHDPRAEPSEAIEEYRIELVDDPDDAAYDGIILCVAHEEFAQRAGSGIRRWLKPDGIVYDLKGVLPDEMVDARL
jgi:UDP-N-acetyl-D-galactosamine dehydrogenase